mmetsp:Transcript_54185/g.126116  ORF Transcript_54185/g.126116 Transcript_54185/m.126116 type:complete len:204 (+) Transcript_54185:679-1290(+)
MALVALSSCRSAVAFFMATSSAAISSLRSLIACESLLLSAESSSMSAVSLSTSAPKFSRDNLFVDSSLSHQSLCCISSVASSLSRAIKSLIIFVTFAKGSSATLSATVARKALPERLARSESNEAARRWAGPALLSLLSSCTRARCRSSRSADGRCACAAPATSGLEMISMALWMASSSLARRTCRFSNSFDFSWQWVVTSCK